MALKTLRPSASAAATAMAAAAVLALAAKGARGQPAAVEVGAECFGLLVVDMERRDTYEARAFFEEVGIWTSAGGALETRNSIAIDILSRPVTFFLPGHSEDTWPNSCVAAYIALLLVNLALHPDADARMMSVPLIGRPWEDLAMSPWPLFELLAIWGDRARAAGRPDEGAFWRTCPDPLTVMEAFWREGEVEAAANALWAATRAPPLFAAIARAAAGTLLGYVNADEWYNFRGTCGALVWEALPALLALSAAMDTGRDKTGLPLMVPPAYALRRLQVVIQRGHMEKPAWDRMDEYVMAPWPVLHLISVLAAVHRTLGVIAQTTSVRSPVGLPLSRLGVQAVGILDVERADVVPAAFTPLDNVAAEQLANTMRVTHSFLEALGVPYIAVAGSLLGAVRHLGRIPWDDDIDLCVDAAHEARLFTLVAALQADRLGLKALHIGNPRAKRAMRYLQAAGYELRVQAPRSLTFRVASSSLGGTSAKSGFDPPAVDIWLCGGLQGKPDETEVTLMSRLYGAKMPRSLVQPRRKLPFGELTIWGPAEPEEVTRLYLSNGGDAGAFRSVCRGRKVHGPRGHNVEYLDEVPCVELAQRWGLPFAEAWRRVLGPELDEDGAEKADLKLARTALGVLRAVAAARLPGLVLGPATVEIAYPDGGHVDVGRQPPRFRISAAAERGAGEAPMSCQALLWSSANEEEDALEPGLAFHIIGGAGVGAAAASGALAPAVLRSLVCQGSPSERPYVWEDTWL